MSKHVDLIAVGALVLAFAFAARVQEMVHAGMGQARTFRLRTAHPVVMIPPSVPAVPRILSYPGAQY
jgi:hypothetical protein